MQKAIKVFWYQIEFSRWLIIKAIIIIGVLIGLGIFIQSSNAAKEDLKQAQALQIFLRIDNYSHEWILAKRPRWTAYSWAVKSFEILDEKFHEAKTLKERFKRAQKIDELLDVIDKNIHETRDTDKIESFDYRDGKYHEIDNVFHQLTENTNIQEIKDAQALQTFLRIDDIAHQQLEHMKATGNPHNFTWAEEFVKIDDNFHKAIGLDERYKRAKEIAAFAKKTDIWLHQVGAIDTPELQQRDSTYHEIANIFDQLQK